MEVPKMEEPRQPLTGFAGFWHRLSNALELVGRWIVGGTVLAIVLITIAAVWYRYGLDAPLSWTEQVSRILFVWSVFVGAALLYRRSLHIVIDLFLVMLPEAMQRVVWHINNVLMLFAAVMIVYFGTQITLGTLDQTFGALEITPATFYAAAPFCGLLILVFWIEKQVDPSTRVPWGEVHL
jgi:TRAP-type transport system small permease protein